MNLIVFETDKLEKEYVLNNNIRKDVNTGSVARGAGSVTCTLEYGEVYETVLFIKYDYFEGKYDEFVNRLNAFIKDLNMYKLIDESTNLL